MSSARKIKMMLAAKGLTMADLAAQLETSAPNLSNKMKRDNFREQELHRIAELLGAKVEITFTLEDGTKL